MEPIVPTPEPPEAYIIKETTVPFEAYIHRATNGAAHRKSAALYGGGQRLQPLLRKGQLNRVLLYPDAFNPPHRGHMRLLQHSFHHFGADFNAIAAVVLPTSKESLMRKNKRSSQTLLVDAAVREQLWLSDSEWPEWAWIMPRDRWWSEKTIDKITQLARADGFVVEFVTVYDPDNFESRRMLHGEWGDNKVLVDTVSRAAKKYSDEEGPPRVATCDEWRDITRSIKGEQDTSILSQGDTRIWHCVSLTDPTIWARYLHSPVACAVDHELISSKSIHHAISTLQPTQLISFLRKFVLSPEAFEVHLKIRRIFDRTSRFPSQEQYATFWSLCGEDV